MFYNKKKLSEFYWESVLMSLPFPVYWKNKQGIYLNGNLAFADFLGVSAIEECIGKSDSAFVAQDKDNFFLVFRDEEVLKFHRVITFNDQTHHVIKVPLRDRKNNVVGIMGLFWDMSQTQHEIVRELHLLDEIIGVMPGHVYWKDRHCILQGCNELQAKDSGLSSRRMIVGKTAYDLLLQNQPEYEKQQQAAITNSYDEEVMKLDKTMTFEEHVVLPDKSIATFLSKKTPLHDEYGNVVGLVGISFDISERKKAEESLRIAKEQAELASRAKTEFLENMRHDIRTPLTGIIGFAELIQKAADNKVIKSYADDLVLAAKALLDFQNEILEVIKVSSAHDAIVHNAFDLHEMIEKVIALLRPKAILKNLTFSVHYEQTLPKKVMGDHKRLFRILLELITNAIKFTDQGSISVTFAAFDQDQTTFTLHAEIKDTGIGIPKHQFEAIYVRFNRLSSAAAGRYEGTGLGLTVVKQFVEALSGIISLESTLGRGTTFFCDIPLTIAQAADLNLSALNKVLKPFSQTPRILLVEDHVMTAKVTSLLLHDLGVVVDVAIDAEEAQTQASRQAYDLILMDLGLPDTNGFLLAETLRKQYGSQLPIVALTAHKELDAEDRCFISGINAIFQKPLLKENAIQLLNTYLKSDSAMREKVIDLSLGAKRLGKTEADAKAMLQLLVASIDKDKVMIEAALQQKNWPLLKQANHKLLGGLMYCGAPILEAACQQLQSQFNTANDALLFEQGVKIIAEIEALKIALQS